MKTIFVGVNDWYGKRTYTPKCDESRSLCELLGQKTLTENNITLLKKLGYEIKTKEEVL